MNINVPFWKRTEVLSLVIATIVLTLSTASSLRDLQNTRHNRLKDQQSRVVLSSLSALMSSLKDAETGQRGYLLTRNPKYLAPYRTAKSLIPTEVERLRGVLPSGQDSQRLFQLVASKMEVLRFTIELQERVSSQAALAVVMTDKGKQDMDALRELTGKLSATEYATLASNSQDAQDRTTRTAEIDFAGGAVMLALLVLSAVTIHRNTARREQLIGLLKDDDLRLRELGRQAKDAEARVRAVLESIADGFISLDKNWSVTYLNLAGERILGCDKESVLNTSVQQQFPDEFRLELEARLREVVARQSPITFEMYSDKRAVWWEQSVYPAKDDGLTIYFRDITERKKLDERNRHTQKLESLGVLAGGIAHDFNNLLTAILGGASLLQEELPPGSEASAHVQIVLNASERAAQLTRQMLAYSGRGRFVIEQLDLAKQVREITALLESSVTRDVELVLHLDTEGILIDADPSQIQQLVMNLVINGAEAIENGPGSVVVTTRLEELDAAYVHDNMAGDNIIPGSYLLLEVHDTGKGMDAQTLSRIFDPFFTTKFTGRGLGLAAVLGIVRGHRGAIKVYSHPGQGTTFKVFFPVSVEQRIARVKEPAPLNLHGTETALIVDDEETVQRMATATLIKYGYRVMQARNGQEAVDAFKRNPDAIGLVLLDMTMPVMSGEETLKQLKLLRENVLVIASSGYNEIEALRRFGQGVSGFLQKPYRASQLAEKVRNALTSQNSE